MAGPGAGPPRAAPWRDAAGIAAASLLLYLVLAQEALHGLDVHVHVFFLVHGRLEHPFHLLYLKLAGAAWTVLQPLGFSPHAALRLLSAVGTALGVLAAHRAAARCGFDRRAAALVTALVAVPPAMVFLATVPEIHGVFAAFAGLCWWAWARQVDGPGWVRAALLGAATGVAASVHATGHLLLGACGALAAARSAEPRRALLGLWPAVAVHACAALAFAAWLRPEGGSTAFADQLRFLRECAVDLHAVNVWRVVRDEWLLAFLPLSVVGLAALRLRPWRAFAGVALAALTVYLAVAYVLLDDINERGAYLLPLALPFAMLTFAAVGARGVLPCVLVALAAAVVQVQRHDRVTPATWVPGFLAVAREGPLAVLCRDVEEQEHITRALPEVPFLRVDSLVATAEKGDAAYPEFCQSFDGTVAHFTSAGRTVLITAPAYEALLATGDRFFARFVHEHLQARYRLEEVHREGFAALRVVPR